MHQQMMQSIPFAGGTLHDPRWGSLRHAVAVLREDSLINEVSDRPLRPQSMPCVSLRGRTLTPGAIDAHRHLVLTAVRFQRLDEMPVTTVAMGGFVARRAIVRAGCFVKHAL